MEINILLFVALDLTLFLLKILILLIEFLDPFLVFQDIADPIDVVKIGVLGFGPEVINTLLFLNFNTVEFLLLALLADAVIIVFVMGRMLLLF